MKRWFLAGLAIGWLALPALAHEGGMDSKGTVKAITADRIEIATAQGAKSFALTSRTEFVKGRAPAKASAIQPGDRVVVHGRPKGATLEAVQVRSASGKAPAR